MPSVWTRGLFEHINKTLEDGASVGEWMAEMTNARFTNMTTDAQGAADFILALKSAGLAGMVHTVGGEGPPEQSLPNMAARAHVCRVFHKHMVQVGGTQELRLAKKQGRTAIIFSVNGPPGVMTDRADAFKWLKVWYHMGVRLMHLSYNRRNHIAGGCTESANDGLSDYGREYVKKMNEVGIIVDTPHSSAQTVLDAARVSTKPIMASHIGVRRLFEHPRCKSDEELKAIAGTGGLIGIYNYPNMLGPEANINTLLDHVDAAVKLIGASHVAIGTDVSYVPGVWAPKQVKLHPATQAARERARHAAGWKEEHRKYAHDDHLLGSLAWTNWPLFTVGLVMRGYKDSDIRKILGENLIRVLDANRPADEVAP